MDVPDWGICFELEKEIPENTTFVGVRAHYIDVSTDLAEAKNSSVMQTDRLLEQQFESELVLKYSTETMSLRIFFSHAFIITFYFLLQFYTLYHTKVLLVKTFYGYKAK